MRRLPPNKIEQNLSGLLNLIPEETDELLQRVDQPLEESSDPQAVIRSPPFNPHSHPIFAFRSRVAPSFCVTTTEMGTPTDLPGPISTILLLTMDFFPPRSSARWKWKPTSSLIPIVSCISRAGPPQFICGTWKMALLGASSSRRVRISLPWSLIPHLRGRCRREQIRQQGMLG
jgi:hypothetical protein